MANRTTLSTIKTVVLVLSLLANLALLAGLYELGNRFRYLYIDYRHFRSQPIGISSATQTNIAAQPSVILFGDSRIETWDPLPELTGFDVINAGVNGETTTEMRRRFQTDVLRLQPEVVVIQAGVNDLTAAATRDIPEPDVLTTRMHENMDYFLAEMDKNNIRVILFSIIPTAKFNLLRRFFWEPALIQSIEHSNEKLKALAEKHNAEWLDVTNDYVDEEGRPRTQLFADTLHLTDAGYKVLNDTLQSTLKNSGSKN